MIETNTLEVLRKIDFLHDIGDENLAELASICQEHDFPTHSTIFQEHEQAKRVYLIISGRVSLAICVPRLGCRQMTEAGDGELIGWSPLVERPRLSDTAITLTRVRALSFDGAELMRYCQERPAFGFEFMRRVADVLAQRLNSARLQLMEACGFSLPQVQFDTD